MIMDNDILILTKFYPVFHQATLRSRLIFVNVLLHFYTFKLELKFW